MTYSQNAAVAGVGMTPILRKHESSAVTLAVDAFRAALDDAGIRKSDVDGLMVFSWGSDYDRTLEVLGLDVRYAFQGWHHGRFLAPYIGLAALVVDSGMADCIALVHAAKTRKIGQLGADDEMWRQGLGPHGESPVYGAVSRAYGAAIAAQRYFHMYGGNNSALAPIAVSLRDHAVLNPGALMRKPITDADHQKSRWVAEPLRLLDCCQVTEGAVCVIVRRLDAAKDGPKGAVQILGMQGVHAGPQQHNLALPGLGIAQQSVYRYEPDDLSVYGMAGVSRDDVDALTIYDAFTPMVLFSLERFGFCGPGEAMDFVKGGTIGPGGRLPVNPSGGLLSEGHIAGWNLLVEMVRQLRHEAGARQVPNCEVFQWASFLGDSLIMARPR
jgi:acetyl-CoA acetyltransferase